MQPIEIMVEEQCDHKQPTLLLPGLEKLLSTFSILDPLATMKPRIFDIPSEVVHNEIFQPLSSKPDIYSFVPKEYLFTENLDCHLVPETTPITNLGEMVSQMFMGYNPATPSGNKLMGLESEDILWAYQQLYNRSRSVFQSKAYCTLYSV